MHEKIVDIENLHFPWIKFAWELLKVYISLIAYPGVVRHFHSCLSVLWSIISSTCLHEPKTMATYVLKARRFPHNMHSEHDDPEFQTGFFIVCYRLKPATNINISASAVWTRTVFEFYSCVTKLFGNKNASSRSPSAMRTVLGQLLHQSQSSGRNFGSGWLSGTDSFLGAAPISAPRSVHGHVQEIGLHHRLWLGIRILPGSPLPPETGRKSFCR